VCDQIVKLVFQPWSFSAVFSQPCLLAVVIQPRSGGIIDLYKSNSCQCHQSSNLRPYVTCIDVSSRTERRRDAEQDVTERRVVRDPGNISDLNADPRCSTRMTEMQLDARPRASASWVVIFD
jgi:hypothetical protein